MPGGISPSSWGSWGHCSGRCGTLADSSAALCSDVPVCSWTNVWARSRHTNTHSPQHWDLTFWKGNKRVSVKSFLEFLASIENQTLIKLAASVTSKSVSVTTSVPGPTPLGLLCLPRCWLKRALASYFRQRIVGYSFVSGNVSAPTCFLHSGIWGGGDPPTSIYWGWSCSSASETEYRLHVGQKGIAASHSTPLSLRWEEGWDSLGSQWQTLRSKLRWFCLIKLAIYALAFVNLQQDNVLKFNMYFFDFSILRWYQILVFPCHRIFFFNWNRRMEFFFFFLISLHRVLVAAWGIFRKIKKIVFRKTILTSSIRWMTGPTVATLTWNTALCETTTICAAALMLKERVSSERLRAVRFHLYDILEKARLWGQQTWAVLGLFEVSMGFWWWNCSVFSLWYHVKTLGTIYMRALMGQFLCKRFFFFFLREREVIF